ncbi:MAG: TolC family protein [Planctomycetes bacterium]|nr:TolC family protein [Planctomycetota bacterium]
MEYRKSVLFLLLIMLFLSLSGCTEQSNKSALPQPRSLGQEFPTFQPPAKPAETIKATTIDEPTGPVTLRKALALALMNNPQLRAFSWDVRISQANQLQASLWPNPELDVEVENVGGPGKLRRFKGATTTIQLSQLIELGGKTDKRIKLASLENQLAGMDYEAKRLDVFTEVTRAFIEALAAQERLKLTKELMQLSQELVDTVAKRVEAGKDSPLEKTKAAVAYSNIKIQHRQALQNLEFARKQLAFTWAGQKPTFESVAGSLDSPAALASIDQLTDLISQNPDIARWPLEIDKGKASLDLEKAKAVSDITLSAGSKRFNATNDDAIVFEISIPLQVSDRNQAGRLEAAYALSRAREEERSARTKIQLELARAYQALSNSHTEVTELDKYVLQAAESVFDASRTGYTQGKLDYLDVLDAQRTLFKAKAKYIDALASFHTAKTDVERLIGQGIDTITDIAKQ